MPYVFVPPSECLTSNVLRLCSSDGMSYALCLTPLFNRQNVLRLCSTDRMSYVFVLLTGCLTPSVLHLCSTDSVLRLMSYSLFH